MSWNRVILLGEDRAHLDFLRGLSSRQSWRVVSEHIAPKGRGAASAWVLKQFPERLLEVAGGRYPGLGLLVAVDGDNVGRRGRLDGLARSCDRKKIARHATMDPVALLVPTWSIDTWLVFFRKGKVIPEGQRARHVESCYGAPSFGFLAPGVPMEDAPRPLKPAALRSLVEGFLGQERDDALPSLDESRDDFKQWTT